MSKFIDNLKSLQPQELEETRQMLDSDEEFAAQFKAEIDQLDAADYELAQSMIMGRPADADAVPQGQQVADARQIEEEAGIGSKALSTLQGFGQAIPFSDQVQAAAGVVADLATGNASLDNLQESFDENMDFIKGYDKQMQEANPGLYTAGRVGGEIGTGIIGGAGVVKALGGAAKLSKAGIVASNLGSDVALETGRLLGQKERITYENFLESAGTASMYAALGLGIGYGASKGLKGIGKYASQVPKKTYEKILMSRGNAKMATRVSNFLADQKLHMNNPITEADYMKAMKDLAGYEDLIKAGNFEDAQLLLKNSGSNMKAAKEGIVRQIESKFGDEFAISAKEAELLDYGIFDEIQKVINKNPGADSATLRQLEQMKTRVTKALSSGTVTDELGRSTPQFGPLNYTRLQNALDSLQSIKKVKIGDFDGEKILGVIRNKKNGLHGIIPRGADEADIKMISALPNMNKKIQIYKHSEDVSSSIMNEMTDMTQRGVLGRALDSAYTTYKRNSYRGGSIGFAIGLAAGTADFAKALLVDPVTIGKMQGVEALPVVKNTLDKVGDVGNFFAYGSGSKSPYAGTLMQRMFTAVHEGENEAAESHFNALDSTQRLLKKPVERNTASFMKNKDDIMNILMVESPEMAEQLGTALSNKDDIGPILSEIANTSPGLEMIQQGIGWEGKVYSEQDKAMLEEELRNNIFVPGDYKVQMTKALREQGIIPDIDSVPKRQPRRYEIKDKRRPY